ncbi:MAG TPA: FHA domain-containing protein [Planctomycetota bacterium]|nr:FHA domain-containing protein [Planctomycetota bacterium]HRU51962.1 FHA domain-containing protein [Planctomycetota bacterium]
MLGNIFLVHCGKHSVQQGYFFSFSKEKLRLYIGNDPEKCGIDSIILQDSSIAPCHISISWQEGKIFLQIEDSNFSTILNDKKVESCISLPSYSTIILGDMRFICFCNLQATKPLDIQQENKENLENISIDSNFFVNDETPLSDSNTPFSNQPKQAKQAILSSEVDVKTENNFVIAEFSLLSLDAPYAVPCCCEIMSHKMSAILGKATTCDYKVEFEKEKYVAEEQALITYSTNEQAFVIKGLVPENPIFINKQKITGSQRLKSGDIIKLGVAANAPKLQFSLDTEDENQKVNLRLAELIQELERGQIYTIGAKNISNIGLQSPDIQGAVLEVHVPERGDSLYINKVENTEIKVILDGTELMPKENRIWTLHQMLEIGQYTSILHDQTNFVLARTPEEWIFSLIVPSPKRGESYLIGQGSECVFKLTEPSFPEKIVEIFVPWEGEYFLVKKIGSSPIPIFIDGMPVDDQSRLEYRFGVNQILTVGNYLKLQNNHRTLPTYSIHYPWKRIISSIFWFIVVSLIIVTFLVYGNKYAPAIKEFFKIPEQTQEEVQDSYGMPTEEKSTDNPQDIPSEPTIDRSIEQKIKEAEQKLEEFQDSPENTEQKRPIKTKEKRLEEKD